MKKITVLVVVLLLMSSCAAPVETTKPVSTELITTETLAPTDTPVPTATYTPEPTSTPTVTPTPAPTSIPVYTIMGKVLNKYVEVSGWEIVLCDETVVEEDLAHGIFLYREDTMEYFCDLEGHTLEPISEAILSNSAQRLFVQVAYVTKSGSVVQDFIVVTTYGIHFPSPSLYSMEDIMSMRGYSGSFEELLKYQDWLCVRMWPLTEEEYKKISSDPLTKDNFLYDIWN